MLISSYVWSFSTLVYWICFPWIVCALYRLSFCVAYMPYIGSWSSSTKWVVAYTVFIVSWNYLHWSILYIEYCDGCFSLWWCRSTVVLTLWNSPISYQQFMSLLIPICIYLSFSFASYTCLVLFWTRRSICICVRTIKDQCCISFVGYEFVVSLCTMPMYWAYSRDCVGSALRISFDMGWACGIGTQHHLISHMSMVYEVWVNVGYCVWRR